MSSWIKKQELMWLENAIRQLEEILIYTTQKSKEYKEAYEQWCELNASLEMLEKGEVKRLAHYDYV